MLNNGELIQNTITEICSYYSKNDDVFGILEEENIDEHGVKKIKLVIIYKNSKFIPNYLGFNCGLNKKFICDDVIVIIESVETIEFGLLGRYFFDMGQSSVYDFLVNGEIIYDKTGKYKELKKSINKDRALKKTKNNRGAGVSVRS